MSNTILEFKIQQYLQANADKIVQKAIRYYGSCNIKPKLKLTNNIETDLGVVDSTTNEIVALFEAKGSVGINGIVGGIGQLIQYQDHIDKKILHKYANTARAFLVIPRETYNKIDWVNLFFPKNSQIVIIEKGFSSFNIITPTTSRSISSQQTIISITPIYTQRDNRLGEYYLGLKMIEAASPKTPMETSIKTDPKSSIEKNLVKIIKNKGNARNIPMSLRGLGFIDHENRLTAEGQKHLRMDFDQFCMNLAYNQLLPFFNVIFQSLFLIASSSKPPQPLTSILTLNKEIGETIKKIFNEDVMYLTYPGDNKQYRYISHWLNILRDDYGAISFSANKRGKRTVKINYFPLPGCPFEIDKFASARDISYVQSGVNQIPSFTF